MITCKKDLKVTTLPETNRNDALGFFEAVALAGFEGKYMRLAANLQRRFFGRVPFGRKAVKVQADGVITTFQTAAFGHDYDTQNYRWNQELGALCYSYNSSRVASCWKEAVL